VTEESPLTQAPRNDQRWSARNPATAVAVYVIAYLVFTLGGGGLQPGTMPIWLGAALALFFELAILLVSILLVLSIARLKIGLWAELAWVALLLALFVLSRPDSIAIAGGWLGNPEEGRRIAQALKITPAQQFVGNIALILWAVLLGRLVSRVVREGKLLLPVAAVASVADTVTVFWGVVAHLTQKAPEVVRTFSAQTPVAAPPSISLPTISSIGIGDFMFLALFLAVAVRYGMDATKAMWYTLIVMVFVAPLPFILIPKLGLTGMPGLPFLSLGVLAANWRYLHFTRDEKRALVFAALLIAAAAAAIVLVLRR
jgi:hypothetical protein